MLKRIIKIKNSKPILISEGDLSTLFEIDSFAFTNNSSTRVSFKKCERCNYYYLSPDYVDIITNLKEAGLLPINYKLLCCICYAGNKRRSNEKI